MVDSLGRMAFAALLLFVIVVPIENVYVVPGVGSLSSLSGLLMLALAVPLFLTRGGFKFRQQTLAVALLGLYVIWVFASLLWTVDVSSTLTYATTFAQLFIVVVVAWQLTVTEARKRALSSAYLIGCTFAVLDGVNNFFQGREAVFQRFAATNTDPNDYALTLVIGIPLAWALFAHERRWWRLAYLLYIPVALAAIVLSASRGGALAAGVALLAVPLGLFWLDRRGKRLVGMIALAGIAAIPFAWPVIEPLARSNFERLSTLSEELATGTLNERSLIWKASMDVFSQHPVIGVGGGALPVAIEREAGISQLAHNTYLSVAVELGVVGFLLFTFVVIVIALPFVRNLGPQTLPRLLMLVAVLIGMMSLTWEFKKPLWLALTMLLLVEAVAIQRTLPWQARTGVPVSRNDLRPTYVTEALRESHVSPARRFFR